MDILQIIKSVDPMDGGPVEVVTQLGATLVSAGHQVEIASLDSPAAPYLQQSRLPVHALGSGATGYAFSTRFIPWLRANRNRYDVAIVNGIWQFHSFGTWCALRSSNTPYILFTHGMLDPWFRKRYPLKHLKKWAYWPWAEYRVLRDARAVLFTCEEERALARSSFWLYRCNEVVVNLGTAIPIGDPEREREEFFTRYPELQHKKLALFIGRICPKKGCDILIEAFAQALGQNPQWHLVMAGPDQVGWRRKLEQRVEQLGLTLRVTWTGMIRGAMKWGALRAAEVLILPSHQENFGIVVAEALSVGAPTLVSNKVNIWREIESAGAGIVAPDTIEGTCRLLRAYIEMSRVDQLAMRQRARECFAQNFEIKKAAQSLQAVLSDITGATCEHLI